MASPPSNPAVTPGTSGPRWIGLALTAVLLATYAVRPAVPRHLTSSTECKTDMLVILLTLVTFHWTLSAAARPTLGRFLRTGLGVGLAVSTKYTGIASAIPITAAVLKNGWRDRRQ